MLLAQHLHLTLDTRPILHDLNLSLAPGSFVGLIGPNGAGKSSLLRLLAGLSIPSAGQVLAQQPPGQALRPLREWPAKERSRWLAYLAQQEKPAWPLAVEHLVELGRSPWLGVASAAEDERAVNEALTQTDLLLLRDRSINQLSGGELQRAQLARVFAGEPKVILADEPIAALDPYHQLHIMELLRDCADQGGLVVAALHDLSLAARFCQRLLLLDEGRLVADGQPIDVLTPENLSQVYGISAYVDCREDGVVVIPRQRQTRED